MRVVEVSVIQIALECALYDLLGDGLTTSLTGVDARFLFCSPSDSEQNRMEREDWRCCCWPRRTIWVMSHNPDGPSRPATTWVQWLDWTIAQFSRKTSMLRWRLFLIPPRALSILATIVAEFGDRRRFWRPHRYVWAWRVTPTHACTVY